MSEPTDEFKAKAMAGFLSAMESKDEDGKSISDYMDEQSLKFCKDADAFWNGLSYDDRLKAFHSVCKRIHQGDIVDRGSYRYVLYQVFGFQPDAYVVGMDCGYLDIHNEVGHRDELDKTRLRLGRIFNEIDCRIEHGADSNGHLEAIRDLFKEES